MTNNSQKENKCLYQSAKKPYNSKGLMNNKEPEFFSYSFGIIMKIFNYVLIIYILMSLTTFLMFHVFDKNNESKNLNLSTNNLNTKIEKIDNLKSPVKNKISADPTSKPDENNNNKNNKYKLDNSQFLSITYTSIYFSILIILNNVSTTNKSFLVFIAFYALSLIISVSFFTNFFNFIPFFYDLNKVFAENTNLITNTFFIFQYTFAALNMIMILYFIVFYMNIIGYFKYNIQDLPFEKIHHEISLRTDMMKISFNHLIISLKLHRILPGLLYTKKDYYFIKSKQIDEAEECSEELYDKVENLETKGNSTFVYSKKNANYSTDGMNSKSTIDCEYESLK